MRLLADTTIQEFEAIIVKVKKFQVDDLAEVEALVEQKFGKLMRMA